MKESSVKEKKPSFNIKKIDLRAICIKKSLWSWKFVVDMLVTEVKFKNLFENDECEPNHQTKIDLPIQIPMESTSCW